ncbi:Uncharacterised protein [Mycobacteroides abscessus subsp. abscessus]|nr:Uncharacterised protein [Mycobacteroides abscessus subsp. abscessus]
MKVMLGRLLLAVAVPAGGVTISAPMALASCLEGEISPAAAGTYSVCTAGQWIHVDRQLCVDYPQSKYCTSAETSTPTYTSAAPAPLTPMPALPAPYAPNIPYVPPMPSAPDVNVPGPGCTWVDGYTKKNGTRVRGHWRCG